MGEDSVFGHRDGLVRSFEASIVAEPGTVEAADALLRATSSQNIADALALARIDHTTAGSLLAKNDLSTNDK